MKKLHSFAFYALIAPAMTLGAGSLLAQQSTELDHEPQSTQHDKDAGEPDSHTAADTGNASDKSRMHKRGYMASSPANAMQMSTLIGAEVKTASDENVGTVSDLIIDENGQVVAILVGVGGFLGMGEKDVAIGWGHVTKSGTADKQELQIDVTREDLRDAPKFETQD